MIKIGLIKEGKIPADNRVALTPSQCRWLHKNSSFKIVAQSCSTRCFKDEEYKQAGVEVVDQVDDCDILFGIKEVPKHLLIPHKTYFFFSHTKKLQPHNKALFQQLIANKNTLIDYECLEHKDGQRMIGFGFFAGVVGAHNGIMCYGKRTGAFDLERVYKIKDYRQLIHTYFGLKLPAIKIAVTGSGRVAHGIVEIMNLMDVQEVETDEYLENTFEYPVYVHLKGKDLYEHKQTGKYNRNHFHEHPTEYDCLFKNYLASTDILLNGVYWDANIPRLFEMQDLQDPNFKITTIADITDDENGSVPCNLGDGTIEDCVYGVDKTNFTKTKPYLANSIDIMAVGNLPNELPRDASRFFGEQLIKYVLDDVQKGGSDVLNRATILQHGNITDLYQYMSSYAL
ncbi:MAG: NAD(P)-dependent oxidoreductase [Chitinophagaceae bacterium]